jgi:hypothetical protein
MEPRDTSAGPPPMPRWVKVLLVLAALVVLALAVGTLLGIEHGPGMHS